MTKLPVVSLFKIILENKSSKRFLFGTIFSLAFSMAVILSTIGLMDGFTQTLRQALSHTNGDIKFSAKTNFFMFDKEKQEQLKSIQPGLYSSSLEIESFAIVDQESKGVLLRGVHPQEFKKITGLDFSGLEDGVLVGKKFKEKFNLKVGDNIVLAFSSKAQRGRNAILDEFRVDGIIEHGIYEKDFRYIYIRKDELEDLLGYKEGTSNFGVIKIEDFNYIEQAIKKLNISYDGELSFSPYWSEFQNLLDAVEEEKTAISMVLQLIVLVAIINVVGFIIFISETKAQDFFMLRALGLSIHAYEKFWYFLLFGIWGTSSLVAYLMIIIVRGVILKLPIFEIPSDVYVLEELSVNLDKLDYIFVFAFSLLWVFVVGYITMRRQSKKSLLGGLRQEFA